MHKDNQNDGEIASSLKSRILTTARKLFTEEPYEKVSMRRIAAEVGCSTMAQYRYFSSKEELLMAACWDHFAQLGRMISAAEKDETAPLEKLRAMAYKFIEFYISHPNLYELLYRKHYPHQRDYPPQFAAISKYALTCRIEGFRVRVAACAKVKALDIDADLTTSTFFACMLGLITGAIMGVFASEDIDGVVKQCVRTLTRDFE